MRFLFALSMMVPLAATARAQNIIGTRDSLTSRVDSIFRTFDRTDAPGCAIGVYRDGRILYARGYGMANLELGVPITPRTAFNIESVTKQFTATAVLLLEQEGKLSLDDPISRYFPEMPPYASGITVRQMLQHTSGLREVWWLSILAGRSFEFDTVDVLRLITRSAETSFPPGTRHAYSNSGFILAGQLVYRLSGQSLGAFLRERVFDPLGMDDTRLPDDPTLIIPGRAEGYSTRGDEFRNTREGLGFGLGNSNLQTTIEDFVRWDRNWDSPTVGGRALVESLVVPGPHPKEETWRPGLGVFVATYRGLRTVGHSGEGDGFISAYLRFPDQKFSVACFCNVYTANAWGLAQAVATVYLSAEMAPDESGESGVWSTALRGEPAVSLSVEELRRFEGVWYSAERGQIRRTRMKGDTLTYVASWSPTPIPLVPLGGNRFRTRNGGAEFVFEAEDTERPKRMQVTSGSGTQIGVWEAMDSLEQLTAAKLAEYAGEYRSEEIEATYRIATDNDHLVIRIFGGPRLGTVEPTWRDAFGLWGEDGGTDLTGALFQFTRDGSGRITGFDIQVGSYVRNLSFIRQP